MDAASLGIGLIGTGFLAETRARCWRSAGGPGRLVAVAGRDPERARAFARRFGIPHTAADVTELLARDDVAAVDLAVPNAAHRPLAEAAFAAGKHVVCTKPLTAYVGQDLGPDASDEEVARRERGAMLATALADAEAMLAAARAAGRLLCYGENWLFAPAIRRAFELARASDARALELRGGECHSGSHSAAAARWRESGGGALLRLGAHPIGAMLAWKRAEGLARDGAPIRPVSVVAEVGDPLAVVRERGEPTALASAPTDGERWGAATITFADGARAVAFGSDLVLGGMESRFEVMTARGRFVCRLSPNDLLSAYAADEEAFAGETLQEKLGTTAGWSTPMPDEDWTSGQLAMVRAFGERLAAAERGEPAPGTPGSDLGACADGELGREVVRVVYAAYRSASEGRRVSLEPPS